MMTFARPNPKVVFAALLLTSAASWAERPTTDWRIGLTGGAVKQFETSLDQGGDFDIERFFVDFSATRNVGTRLNTGLNIGYGERKYKFSGHQGFGVQQPWGTIQELQISVPLRYRGSGNWTYFGIPSFRYNGEKGADNSDSQQWGLLAGAAYRVSDTLSIGPGVGVFSEIESSTDVFPILLIDWKLSDTLSLETGRGLAASRGPGLALRWTPVSTWSFSLAARYEKTRFRLDKDGPIPGGVGEDKAFPVGLSASYRPDPRFEISLIGGADFAGNLRLEDAQGDKLSGSDYDVAPFAGIYASAKF